MTIGTEHQTNVGVSLIGMFVIDVLRYDVEKISSILKLLNDETSIGWRFAWERDFTDAEVIEALKELLSKRLITPLREERELGKLNYIQSSDVDWNDTSSLWFELTEKGQGSWEQWENFPIK